MIQMSLAIAKCSPGVKGPTTEKCWCRPWPFCAILFVTNLAHALKVYKSSIFQQERISKEMTPLFHMFIKAPVTFPPLEGLNLKLKHQYFGHLMQRAWCWERLGAGGEGATEDDMVGWHHGHNGHEFERTPGDAGGRGSRACCSARGCKELEATEQSNNSNIPGRWSSRFHSSLPNQALTSLATQSLQWLALWIWGRR